MTVSVNGVAGAPGFLDVLWQAANPMNVAVSMAAGDQDGQQIISDGANGAIIVWQDRRNGNVDIYAQRLNSAGVPQWTIDGVAITVAADDQLAPQLVADGAGGAIIVWQDQRRGTSAFLGKDSDIYAQRVNSAGVVQWNIDGVAIATLGQHSAPQLIADGAGGAILTWSYLLRNGNTGTVLADEVYAQRVNSAGVPQWTAGGVALSAAALGPALPRLIADGAGGAIVAWMGGRDGVSSSLGIYAQRVDSAGLLQWTADGKQVSSNNNLIKFYPQLVTDGAGGAIVAWTVEITSVNSNGVYAQHINAAGESQWTAGDVLLSKPLDVQAPDKQTAQLIPDGVGGAIVAWQQGNLNVASSFDVYAQRVNGAGVVQWVSGGVGIATESGNQKAPQLIADGSNGAILAWQGQNNGNYDIYTQRVNAAGVAQWLTATVMSTAGGDQTLPRLISNGLGGAIAVWSDRRNGNSDIYAQDISASGR